MVATIIRKLRAEATADRKLFSQRTCPTSMEILGVTNPDIKELLKSIWPKVKAYPVGEVLTLAKNLVRTRIFECNNLAYEIIWRHKKALHSIGAKDIEWLGENIDNWASVDTLAVLISGVAWREGQISDNDVLQWLASENQWWRRLAVVSTVPLNLKSRGGKGDIRRTLMICERVVEDRKDLVVKALSWALRELSKRNKAEVKKFMLEHEDQLAARVRKEVHTKLETGRKNG